MNTPLCFVFFGWVVLPTTLHIATTLLPGAVAPTLEPSAKVFLLGGIHMAGGYLPDSEL